MFFDTAIILEREKGWGGIARKRERRGVGRCEGGERNVRWRDLICVRVCVRVFHGYWK